MKPIIKELAEQAGFVLWDEDEEPYLDIDWSSNYDEELEKFANIIVMKCLGILVDKGNFEGGAVDSFNEIAKYFDVNANYFDMSNEGE